MTFQEKYPDAYEDEYGIIWVSKDASLNANWKIKYSNQFLDDTLGWGWKNAEQNFRKLQKTKAKIRSIKLRKAKTYEILSCLKGFSLRDWYERVSLVWVIRVIKSIWFHDYNKFKD